MGEGGLWAITQDRPYGGNGLSYKARLLRYARNDKAAGHIWSNLKNCEGEDFISACVVGSVPLRKTSTVP
jgi:hypothetical protein